MEKIKRVVVGGYIAADMTGTGDFEFGRISRVEGDKIYFTGPGFIGEQWVHRNGAYKGTKSDIEAAQQVQEMDPVDMLEEVDPTESTEIEVEVEEEEEQEVVKSRSIVDQAYKDSYVKVKKANGCNTQDSGDPLAIKFRSFSLEMVYEFAAQVLETSVNELQNKYDHLNNGQQRMVLGNRIRRAL